MSETKKRPERLYWIGQYDAFGNPLEYFGGVPGERDPIPARDLTPDETAQLTEAQWAAIESDAGRRLYSATKPSARSSATTSKDSRSATEPSSTDAASAAS